MNIIGTKNGTTQEVLTNGIINLGSTYRRFECPRNAYYDFEGSSIVLKQSGMYHITATLVGSGQEAGLLSVNLAENGIIDTDVIASQTITTATTETRELVIDYVVLVDETNILGYRAVAQKAISLVNTGVDATFTNVIVNICKEVK